MFIETPRLIIRKFEKIDLDALFAVLSDPEVMRYSLSGPYTRERAEKFLDDMLRAYLYHSIAQYAVVLKESSNVIGFCGFFTVEINQQKETELAYRLARKYWGQGYGTEAAMACRDYAFLQLRLAKLVSTIEPANVASIRVAEKVGLELEQETVLHNVHALVYAITNKNT